MAWNKMKWLMAPEDQQSGGGTTTQQQTGAQQQQQASTQQQQQQQQGEQVTTRNGKVIPMATHSIDKLKKENQEKGWRRAQTEMEQKAKALGFDSVDEMLKAAERAKKGGGSNARQERSSGNGTNGGGGKKKPQTQAAADPQQTRRAERRDRETQARLDRERQQRLRAERQAEEARNQAWAAEANGQLQVLAIRAGITDPDYAVELLAREMNRNRAQLDDVGYDKYEREFDEAKFFDELKKTRPYLFKETVVAATTGTTQSTNGTEPPPPGAGAVTQAAARAAQTNAKNMSKEEYAAELRRRGLQPPSV